MKKANIKTSQILISAGIFLLVLGLLDEIRMMDYFLDFYFLHFATRIFTVSGATLFFAGIINNNAKYNKYFKNRKRKILLFSLMGLGVFIISVEIRNFFYGGLQPAT